VDLAVGGDEGGGGGGRGFSVGVGVDEWRVAKAVSGVVVFGVGMGPASVEGEFGGGEAEVAGAEAEFDGGGELRRC
jgi:hypothetical protein